MASPGNILLPPDQSFRKIQRDQTTILLSVSEEGVHLGPGSDFGKDVQNSPKGFYIFAEKVRLNGPFSITLSPTQTLATLSTHSLSLDKNVGSALIVSGAPGISNDTGAAREDTIDGELSGSLSVYVEDCSTDMAHLIQYSANGGSGGDTIEKMGNAGNGGQGGSVQWVGYSTFSGLSILLYQFAINKVLNEKLPESEILTPSHPIMVYLRDALTVADLIPRPESSGPDIKSIVDIIKPIKSIVQSVNSATIKDARAAVWEVRQDITKQYQADERAIESRISVSGGNAGSVNPRLDAGERGSAGKPGQPGTRSITFLRDVSKQRLSDLNAVFVHPEQCQMLYDRAMVYWYFGRTSTAIQLLSRLVLRLSFLPLDDDAPLAKAYASQEGTLRTKGSVAALTSLLKTVLSQLSVLQSGQVDYYGNTTHWVPRVSFEEYNKYINDAMGIFQKIETSYVKYHAALETQQSVNEVIHQTKAQLDVSIAAVGKERNTLLQQLKDLDKKIELAGPEVEEKHRAFQAEYTEFAKEVDEAHKITPNQIFNALSNIASPGSWGWGLGMTGVTSAVSLGYDWENNYPDDQGNLINKKYLINQIRRSLATGLADFNAEFTTDKLSGDFVLDDRLPQFLMEQQQLDGILSDYSTASFADAGDQLKKCYKDFTDALTARNNDILAYNSIIQTIATQDQQVAQMRDMRKIADKGEIINEDLEQMTGYIRILFENARARVMRYLVLGRRALTFKVLQEENLLDMSDGGATGDIPLSVTSDVLLTIRSNLSNLLLTATEDNSGAPAQFPADWNKGQGKHRYLSDEELRFFLANKRVAINFSPVIDSLSSDFANSVNIRVYRVRFTLVGVRTVEGASSGLMKSLITHGGVETIVSRRGVPFFFEHSALDTLHSYYVNGDGNVISTLDDGTLVHRGSADRAPIFGAPGPFTRWTIDSTNVDWRVLDTSKVTGAYLEFFGTNYAPHPDAYYKSQ